MSQRVLGFLFIVNLVCTWSSVFFGKLADRRPRRAVLALAVVIFIIWTLLTIHFALPMKIVGISLIALGFFRGIR